MEQSVYDERLALDHYTRKNRKTYVILKKMAKEIRYSQDNVNEWQALREFVLKNPTANYIPEKYILYGKKAELGFGKNNMQPIIKAFLTKKQD